MHQEIGMEGLMFIDQDEQMKGYCRQKGEVSNIILSLVDKSMANFKPREIGSHL